MYHLFLTLLLASTSLMGSCHEEKNDLKRGTCYEQEGNTNLAQAAYERAILEDVNTTQARLKLAALYRSMKMPKQSNALLQNVDNTQLTPRQRTALTALRNDDNRSLSTLHARVTLDAGYDSNININPIDNTYISTTDEQIETIFSRMTVKASYLHDLSSVGGWYLRSDADIYYQNNASGHDYDVLYGRLYAGGGYRSENIVFYLPLFYDRLNYLDRDLLQESGLRPDLNIQLSSSWILDLNAYYSNRRYIQNMDTDRDDDLLGGGAGVYWLNAQNMAYFKVNYLQYNAHSESAPDYIDKTFYSTKIGAVYTLFEKTDLFADYRFILGNYADTLPTETSERQDYNHDLSIALEQEFFNNFKLRGSYRYLYNDSNLDIATYQKNEIMFGLVYNY